MNSKAALFTLMLIFFLGISVSLARPQYVSNLTAVYGGGSCNTCHVVAQGPRDSNGNFGIHNPNGTYEPRNFNRTNESRNTSRTFGSRNSNRTFPRNSYGTLFENQPNHANDPGAALMAIGEPPSTTADTPETGTGAQEAPGFEIMVSVFGLFAVSLLERGHKK